MKKLKQKFSIAAVTMCLMVTPLFTYEAKAVPDLVSTVASVEATETEAYDPEEDPDSVETSAGDSSHTISSKYDPLKYVSVPNTKETELESILASYYELIKVFAVAGMVFSFIHAGIKFFKMPLNTRASKEDILNTLGTKFLVFVMLCSMVLVVDLASSIYKTFK